MLANHAEQAEARDRAERGGLGAACDFNVRVDDAQRRHDKLGVAVLVQHGPRKVYHPGRGFSDVVGRVCEAVRPHAVNKHCQCFEEPLLDLCARVCACACVRACACVCVRARMLA
jgi:hypothetical protein